MPILPFCGTIYNPDKFTNLSEIIAPPYDVITPEERRFLLSLSKYNSARLILGDEKTGDFFEDEFYTGTKELIKQWHEEKILCKREQPGLFFLHQFFTGPDGEQHIRKGFIALMPIEDIGPETVRAHEKTHKGPINDRLRLTATTKVNFSQIFFTYQDSENRIIHLLDEAVPKAIHKIDGKNEDTGVENICYLIEDEDVIEEVQVLMEDKPVFIADGHHRYETLTQYRDQRLEETGLSEIDANYIMAYFACAQDVGLKVYPTHRTIRDLPDFSYQILLDKIMKYFTVEPIDAEDVELGADHRNLIMSDEEDKISSELPFPEGAPRDLKVSFEFFPPKTEKMSEMLWASIQRLEPLQPRFVSVTYGAGGGQRDRSFAAIETVAKHADCPIAAHLTCVGVSRDDATEVYDGLYYINGHDLFDFCASRLSPNVVVQNDSPLPDWTFYVRRENQST